MEKYSVVINGSKKRYEISIATESNLEWAKQSYGWFGLNKILVKEGRDATDEKWNEILTIAQKLCDGLNNINEKKRILTKKNKNYEIISKESN